MKSIFRGTLLVAALASPPALAQDNGHADVSAAIKHDTLPSLRHAVPQPDGYARWTPRDEHELPMPYFPPGQRDGAVQGSTRRAPLTPSLQSSFDGVGDGFSGPSGTFATQYAPPDTVGAVGATQYLQIVNSAIAVFDKATKLPVYGPVPTNTLWSGFGGSCEADNDGDAVIVYDKTADRWVASQFAVAHQPYLECVAVSVTNDATGAWNRYAFGYTNNFPDYPKMGVWPDAYYVTLNVFKGNSFQGAQLCAYDRASMLAGNAATQQCFQLVNTYAGVLPADLDGPTPPPAGAPNYLINFDTNALNLWRFHVDWTTPANTTLTGPTSMPVAAFSPACGGGVCVPQAGVKQQLDSLGDRMMFRLAYRNFGAYETLVANHSVTVGPDTNPYTGVRWYEIRSPGSTPVVYQQSTYAPDTSYRWMGSVAMDAQGDIALGYSVSSSALVPAIRYAARLAGDPLGALQAETSIIEGTGAQSGSNLNRWGDYSAMAIDPVDDCTFWYTNEYLRVTGAFNWNTRIATFAFPECDAARSDQTITFTSTAPSGVVYNDPAYTVTASSTSGLPVALKIDAASTTVCTLDGALSGAHVSIIATGVCTINASQAGNPAYRAAPPAQQSFTVSPASQSIQFDSPAPLNALAGGTPYTVLASATSGLPVALAIDAASTAVCQISGSASGASVSFIGIGACTINASQAGNANYAAALLAQQSFDVAIGPPSQLIFSTQPTAVLQGGALATIAASETDAVGDVIDDSSVVDFAIAACGGSIAIGSVPMVHGVATLTPTVYFYTSPATWQVTATTGLLVGTSDAFAVQGNAGFLYADGFDGCRL